MVHEPISIWNNRLFFIRWKDAINVIRDPTGVTMKCPKSLWMRYLSCDGIFIFFEKPKNPTYSFSVSPFQNQSVAAFEILTRPNSVVHWEHQIDNILTRDRLIELRKKVFALTLFGCHRANFLNINSEAQTLPVYSHEMAPMRAFSVLQKWPKIAKMTPNDPRNGLIWTAKKYLRKHSFSFSKFIIVVGLERKKRISW